MTITIKDSDLPGEDAERFDFSRGETVVFQVVDERENRDAPSWRNHSVDVATVVDCADHTTGAAQYEESYGCGLASLVQSLIEMPGAGWFAMEGVTAEFFRGDGWSTDDDMRFEFTAVRPATPSEIEMA